MAAPKFTDRELVLLKNNAALPYKVRRLAQKLLEERTYAEHLERMLKA